MWHMDPLLHLSGSDIVILKGGFATLLLMLAKILIGLPIKILIMNTAREHIRIYQMYRISSAFSCVTTLHLWSQIVNSDGSRPIYCFKDSDLWHGLSCLYINYQGYTTVNKTENIEEIYFFWINPPFFVGHVMLQTSRSVSKDTCKLCPLRKHNRDRAPGHTESTC